MPFVKRWVCPHFSPCCSTSHFFPLTPWPGLQTSSPPRCGKPPKKMAKVPRKTGGSPKVICRCLLGNLGIHFANAKKLTVTIHSDYTLDSWGSVGKIRPSSHIIKTASIQSKCSMRSSFSTRTLFEFLSTRWHQLTFHCGLAEAVCTRSGNFWTHFPGNYSSWCEQKGAKDKQRFWVSKIPSLIGPRFGATYLQVST